MIESMETFTSIWTGYNRAEKETLACQLETSRGWLMQIAHGHGKPSKYFADALAAAIGHGVTRFTLFPGLFVPSKRLLDGG